MSVNITKIDDKSDGFRVEFTVITTYSQVFPPRPLGIDQMTYAREQVQTITPVVEKPTGVVVAVQPMIPEIPDAVIDLTDSILLPDDV